MSVTSEHSNFAHPSKTAKGGAASFLLCSRLKGKGCASPPIFYFGGNIIDIWSWSDTTVFGSVDGMDMVDGGGMSCGAGGGVCSAVLTLKQDTEKARRIIKNALKRKNLSKCLHKFFGPGTILTNKNLPRIDSTENLPGPGRTYPEKVPDVGRPTVNIDPGTFAMPADDTFLTDTYLHETANALALQRFTNVFPRWMRPFMGASGSAPTQEQQHGGNIGIDPDIGQQVEECLHGH